jgi:hypothetical protein
MSNSANVIDLSGYRKAATTPLPQPKQLPWHINEALWILQETGEMEDQFFLTDWEIKFVTSMATWRDDLTPKQNKCLKRIGDRMEAALKVQEQPPASASPDDAS